MDPAASQPFIFFKAQDLPATTFKVVAFTGTEAISTLFAFELDVISSQRDLDFQKVLGKKGYLKIAGEKGDRHVHGVVRRIEETSRSAAYTRFSISLVPNIWKLSLRQTSRIFQGKTIPVIVEEVLKGAQLQPTDFTMTLHGKHLAWEYCVQYRESDLDFVSRLLEQEGVFYFFEHGTAQAVMRMGDAPSDHPKAPGVTSLPLRASAGMPGKEETLLRFVVSEEVRPDASVVRDYNFKTPLADMEGNATEAPGLNTEVYDAPGEYDVQAEGRDIAKLRLQELRATRRICSGETTCARLMPGHTFEVSKHPRADLNRKYMILDVTQQGSQPQILREEGMGMPNSYSAAFRCIPADVPFRPPRVTRRPLAQGAQTAVVVGPPQEEIHRDEFGRIQVKFHWDRSPKKENTTCYMRVAQGWAGSGWGTTFIPRIGQEVIVEFLDGDPDQPIVTGAVYNAEHMPPYSPTGEKTKTTIRSNSTTKGDGFNEIRFDDKKGSEQIFVHAEKDVDVIVKKQRRESIQAQQHLTVGGSRYESIGADDHLKVKTDRVEEIGGDQHLKVTGDHNEDIGAQHSLKVGTNYVVDSGQTITGTAGQEIYLKGGMKVVIEAGMQLTLKGPGGFISIDPSGVTVQGMIVKINSGGSAGSGSAKSPKAPKAPKAPAAATDKPA